ncbi:sigma-70 family RNA polymerase sigma factor [Sinomicrobium kalidii]|uniref:RNA polymerase sigma factor n=1 Tax=Sinomicrobium kalidii TaxID=2900738 RepID=UPI001E3F53AA|nr:sigma-70 family RNA polymerase sigma factor [Sinomicrobium kalidii]UGU17327.1 sigma-70 family RNA polymerase sigma factor [Sinomicrobium kalidii]
MEVKSLVAENDKIIEVFITRHSQKIYNFIFSKVLDKNITEDIFQDTFIKVVKTLKKGDYTEEGKFLSWVMRIAHNLVIDHFRQNQRKRIFRHLEDFSFLSGIEDASPDAEKYLIKQQTETSVKKLIKELPPDQQDVIIMRIYREMTFKEISEEMGVNINTSLGRMRYALTNLRKIAKRNNISI